MKRLLIFLCSLFLPFSVFATENLIVGVPETDAYPLFRAKNGDYQGFCREALDLFAKEYGYSFTYSALPIKRLFLYLGNGKVSIKFPDDPLLQPEGKLGKGIYYSKPLITVYQGLLILKTHTGSIKSVSLVNGWVVNDTTLPSTVQRLGVPSLESAIMTAFRKHTDGFWANLTVARYTLKQMGKEELFRVNTDVATMPFQYSLSSKDRKLVSNFDDFIVKYNNKIESLKVKYSLSPWGTKPSQ